MATVPSAAVARVKLVVAREAPVVGAVKVMAPPGPTGSLLSNAPIVTVNVAAKRLLMVVLWPLPLLAVSVKPWASKAPRSQPPTRPAPR